MAGFIMSTLMEKLTCGGTKIFLNMREK